VTDRHGKWGAQMNGRGVTRFIGRLVLLCAVAAHVGAQTVAARAPIDAVRGVASYAQYVESAMPAVVSVVVAARSAPPPNPMLERFGLPPTKESTTRGTGFVVDAAGGLIVTANFLLNDVALVKVILHDGREVEASVVGRDAESDVALLRVKADGLAALLWADPRSARVGDVVLAIGVAEQLGMGVTAGIVSGFSSGTGQFQGRNLDSKGRVLGVAAYIYAKSGDSRPAISCALAATDVQKVVKDLIAFGYVKRPYLGVRLRDEFADDDFADGVQLREGKVAIELVDAGSPAERAGMRVGDVVVAAAGRPVRSVSELTALVRSLQVGATLPVTVLRGGMERSVSVVLGEAPPKAQE
jgi:serine protease DegQ